MALMNAIANNTQQAFANREAVQRQELAAGLQVASAISQDQVRKQQISASRQAMSLQMKRFESEEKVRRVEEGLLPLKARAKEIEYEANILNGTKALVDPFLVEEKAMLQGFVMQNPDKAMEAANAYNSMFGELANKSVSDPTFDINSELPQKKKALREWITQQTQVTTPSNRLAPLQPTGSLMDSMSQPMPQARSISDLAPSTTATPRRSAALTPEQAASASAAFAAIGGNPILFNQSHDPITRTNIDSAIKRSMINGEMPSPEIAQLIPQNQLLEIARAAARKQESKTIIDQIDSYGSQLATLSKLKEQGKPVDGAIDSLTREIERLSARQVELSGFGEQREAGDTGSGASGLSEDALSSIINETVSSSALRSSTASTIEAEDLSRDFSGTDGAGGISSILIKLSPDASDDISNLGVKYVQNPDSVKPSDIKSIVDKSSLSNVASIANADWFKNHIKEMRYDVDYDENGGRYESRVGKAMRVLTSNSKTLKEDVFSSSPNRLLTTERDRRWSNQEKEEAKKVLKSELPNILFKYLNRDR